MPKSKERKSIEHIQKAVARHEKRIHQIKEWVHGGNLYNISTIRVPGFPPSHYVEERRLEEALLDLGKKRSTYLSRFENEKVVFIEKQKRKSSAIRRRLSRDRNDVSRGWTVADRILLTRQDSSRNEFTLQGTTYKSDTDLDKEQVETLIENFQNEQNQKLVKENTGNPSSRGKTVQFANVFQTEPHFSRENTKDTTRQISRTPTFVRTPSMHRERSKSKSLPMPSLIPWAKLKSMSIQPGNLLPPLTSDPRYSRLENLLCPSYVSKYYKDVVNIVDSVEALHAPPKQVRVSKLQRELSMKRFLRERGFVS